MVDHVETVQKEVEARNFGIRNYAEATQENLTREGCKSQQSVLFENFSFFPPDSIFIFFEFASNDDLLCATLTLISKNWILHCVYAVQIVQLVCVSHPHWRSCFRSVPMFVLTAMIRRRQNVNTEQQYLWQLICDKLLGNRRVQCIYHCGIKSGTLRNSKFTGTHFYTWVQGRNRES